MLTTLNPIISVIVPSYNVEKYIEPCIESILNQTLPQIEIIIIDDGSTDNTLNIIKDMENSYNNIKVYKQPNLGPGEARNLGLKKANGMYIGFVDSDDYINKRMYQKMYEHAEKNSSDIVIVGVKRFNTTRTYDSPLHRKSFADTIENTTIYQTPSLIYDTSVWNKLFKKDFLESNKIVFPKNLLYEDIEYATKCLFHANRIGLIEEKLYHWRVREDKNNASITQSKINYKNFNDRMVIINNLMIFCEKYRISQKMQLNLINKWLTHDINLYFPLLENVNERYIYSMVNQIKKFMSKFESQIIITSLSSKLRIYYECIMKDDIKALKNAIKFFRVEDKNKNSLIYKQDGRWFKELPFTNTTKANLDITNEIKIESSINYINWKNDELVVKFDVIFNESLDLNEKPITYGSIYNFDKMIEHYIDVHYDYEINYAEIRIDLITLYQLLKSGRWKLKIFMEYSHLKLNCLLTSPVKGEGPRLKENILLNNLVLNIYYNANWELIINLTDKGK